MLEAFSAVVTPFSPGDLFTVCLRLFVAWLLGCGIAWLYRWVRSERANNETFPATLILLSILIAIVTQVIGDHLARAFGLVGALSIVRFRTVVEDTYDIAFVIYAVVVGMAAGASAMWLAVTGFVMAGLAIVILKRSSRPGHLTPTLVTSAQLKLRIGATQSSEIFLTSFNQFFNGTELRAVETGRGGAAIDLLYQVILKPNLDPLEVVQGLQRLTGVQSVEFKLQDS